MSIPSNNLLQMPIALLKFPTDLLGEVFKLCDPFDLYKLSKCSKRTQKSVTLGGTKKWKISFRGRDDVYIWAGSYYYFKQADKPEDDYKTNLGRYTNDMYIKFPNGDDVDLFVYLIEAIGIRIVNRLEIRPRNIDNVSKIAKVLIDRNTEIEIFTIAFIEKVQDVVNCMPLMRQMNITQDFQCFIKFPPDFHFEFVKFPNQIYIRESSWFNINQLLDCSCTEIRLLESTLSNQDLDLFIRKWKKKETFPNLRWLEIWSQKIDNQSPILELNPPIENVNSPRIRVSIPNGYQEEIVDAVLVIKDDGTEGRLKVELGEWSTLKFLIADPADTVVEELPEEDL